MGFAFANRRSSRKSSTKCLSYPRSSQVVSLSLTAADRTQLSSLAFLSLLDFPISRNAWTAFRRNASKPGV